MATQVKFDPKMNKAKGIPDGYHVIIPYLTIDGVAEAIEFYKKAFGAEERLRVPGFDGKVGHAEIVINGHAIMLTDEFAYLEAKGPRTLGGTTSGIHIYFEDVDSVVEQALAAGCRIVFPIEDQFCGNRSCGLADPFGHNWYVATHTEDMSNEEMYRRAHEAIKAHESLQNSVDKS
jgi:PhnB protein